MSASMRAAILGVCTAVLFAVLGLSVALGLRLQAPTRLVALSIPVALILAEYVHALWRRAFLARLGAQAEDTWRTRRVPARQHLLSTLLLVVASTLLVIASARPQWGERAREVERRGIDIVFAVDLSRSMLATDLPPSRLEATTAELERLMRGMQGDRVGLVVFAADAVKQSPLTSDYGAIRHYLRRVHPDHFSRQGTAIGRAIHASVELLTGDGREGFRRASNQLIVVLSDGEDTVSDPLAAAESARAQGIRVYVAGMGTAEGGMIPLRTRDDRISGYLTDRDGSPVVTQLEEEQLTAIAAVGGGAYRRYTTSGSISTFLEHSIRTYEAETLSSVLRAEYVDRFAIFLFPALLLLVAATRLRTELPPRWATIFRASASITVVWLLGAGCDSLPERDDPSTRAAIQALERGEIDEARESLDAAGALARGVAAFAYNYGLVEAEARRWEAAQVRLLEAIPSRDILTRSRALFALGNTLLERERWDEAMQRYRRVLEIDPDHAGARRNLEIALLRAFPPCESLDDDWEENDDAATAPDLPASFYRGDFIPPQAPRSETDDTTSSSLVLCGGDADWFALPLLGGSTLTVEVTFRRLREDTGSTPPPERIESSAVRIALLEYDSVSVLAVDQGLAHVEEDGLVPGARVQRRLDAIRIPDSMGVDATGFLKIEATPGLEYSYTLRVTVEPPCWALEDEWEPNDLAATASRVQERDQVIDARLCPGNDDWYRVDLPAGETLFIDTEPLVRESGEPGTPIWSVYIDDPGTEALQWEPTEERPVHTWAIDAHPDDRVVWLRVHGTSEEDEGRYRAALHRYPPCPEGNDRYESNDTPREAYPLSDEGPGPFRHLRLCPGDQDWYAYALPPAPEDDEGDDEEPRVLTAIVEMRGADQRARLRVLEARTGRLLATSVAERDDLIWQEAALDPAPPPSDGTSSPAAEHDDTRPSTPEALALGEYGPTTLHIAIFEAPPDGEPVLLVVEGDPTWYHLTLPELEQMEQEQQQQPQDPQEQDDGEPNEDGEPDEAQDSDDSADESADSDPAEDDDESDEEEAAQDADGDETEEERRERLMRLLESLERDDVNLQIEQTLRNAPPERIERPW
jgi:Ca-activated chloride channel family protein